MTKIKTASAGIHDIIRGTVPHIHGEGYAFADPGNIISAAYLVRKKIRNRTERCEYYREDDKTGYRFADTGDRLLIGSCCTDEDLREALKAAAIKWDSSLAAEGNAEFIARMNSAARSVHMTLAASQTAESSNDLRQTAENSPAEITIQTDRDRAEMFSLFCHALGESPQEAASDMFDRYLKDLAFDTILTLESSLDPVRAREDKERDRARLRVLKGQGAAVLTEPAMMPERPVSAPVSSVHAAPESKVGKEIGSGPENKSPLLHKEGKVPHTSASYRMSSSVSAQTSVPIHPKGGKDGTVNSLSEGETDGRRWVNPEARVKLAEIRHREAKGSHELGL